MATITSTNTPNKKRKVIELLNSDYNSDSALTPSSTFPINPQAENVIPNLSLIESKENTLPSSPTSDDDDDVNNGDEKDPTINDLSLSFTDWIKLKRNTAHRKRFILSTEEYNTLLKVLNDTTILIGRQDLKWIIQLKLTRKLYLIKALNREKTQYIDVVVAKKAHKLIPNEVPFTRVVKMDDIESVICSAHIACAHAGIGKTFKCIQKEYCFVPRSAISAYIARCQKCVEVRDRRKKSKLPLNPIISHGTFEHVVIDLIDFSNKPSGPNNSFNYIVHAVDHFSTFHFTDVLQAKTAYNVLRFLHRLFSFIGYPCILHSDNGSEFKNELVDSYLRLHNIEHRRGKPRRPTTQGKVERANRTLKRVIRQLVKESNYTLTWFDVVFEATNILNTTHSTLINKSPYVHVFHQEVPRNEYKVEVEQDEDIGNSDSDSSDFEDNNDANLNHEQVLDAIVKRIARDSQANFDKGVNKMKQSYDKRFAPKIRHIGEIVALCLSEDVYIRGEANKLPVVVVGNKVMDGIYYYILGYKNKIIKGLFAGCDLESVNRVTFGPLVGIPVDQLDDQTIFAGYGLLRNGYDYNIITVKDAYLDYNPMPEVSLSSPASHPESIISLIAPSHPENIIPTDESNVEMQIDIPNPHIPPTSPIPENIGCSICDAPILPEHPPNRCTRCKKYYHTLDKCKYGPCQVQDASGTFCSQKCLTNVQVYELEIIGETPAFYKVRWNNGDVSTKSKKRMNSMAEYYKLITIWRQTQLNSSLASKSHLKTSSSSSSLVITQDKPDSSLCKVCQMPLDESNIHSCHSCGDRMHGYIICTKKELIFLDKNDNVYCHICHPQPIVVD
jgi:hypothetical protein